MELVRFEVIEKGGFHHLGEKFEEGDIRSHKDGQMFVDLGWAKDMEGSSGERKEGVAKLEVNSVKTSISGDGSSVE